LSTLKLSHYALEEKAVDYLKTRGFKRIEVEWTVEGYGRADVVAFDNGILKVVVECGSVDNEKVAAAKNLQVEFVWISRDGTRIVEDVFQTKKIEELHLTIDALSSKVILQSQNIGDLEIKVAVAEERFIECSYLPAITESFYDSAVTDYYLKRRKERLAKDFRH